MCLELSKNRFHQVLAVRTNQIWQEKLPLSSSSHPGNCCSWLKGEGKLCSHLKPPPDGFGDENSVLVLRPSKRKSSVESFILKSPECHRAACAGLIHASLQGPRGDLVFLSGGGERGDYLLINPGLIPTRSLSLPREVTGARAGSAGAQLGVTTQ